MDLASFQYFLSIAEHMSLIIEAVSLIIASIKAM